MAMSVHSPCTMQQMQSEDVATASMMSMNMTSTQDTPHMDCMKVEKSLSQHDHQGHDRLCQSGQDCVMYNVQLAYSASTLMASQPQAEYLTAQNVVIQHPQFLPAPDLFGLWRPPRTL